MHFHIVTLFPELFASVIETTMLKKGQERGALQFTFYDIRAFATDKHRVTDDTPYGGGQGMVMKPEPLTAAIEATGSGAQRARRVLLCPQGPPLSETRARALAAHPQLALICGRYEGVDERVRTRVDEVVSLGDFVLAGGETAALAVIEAVARLVPGVLGNAASATDESFTAASEEHGGLGLLEYPQYTRPASYRGLDVPAVLRSGDHGAVARWRRAQSVERTRRLRPDLLAAAEDTDQERGRRAEGPAG
jgi:tRNA (guanine37-N1)-methyltransferase